MSGKIRKLIGILLVISTRLTYAQVPVTAHPPAIITLDSFVVSDVQQGFNVQDFIQYVKDDTSFYEAFQNLRRINYHSSATLRFFDEDHLAQATYSNRTVQYLGNGCRWMDFLFEAASGDFFDKEGQMNYYTSRVFSYIFLYRDTICHNIVTTDNNEGTDSKLEKHKEQLKTLIFDPGQPVDDIPFIKNKLAIFDEAMAPYYDYSISRARYSTGVNCYVFTVKKKPQVKDNDVVIKELTTWFDVSTLDIVARDYALGFDAPVFDFDVQMKVRLADINGYRVPDNIYYNGYWDIPGRKPETGSVQISVWQ